MILATSEHYIILQQRKIIPAERILILRERSGVPTETNFVPLDQNSFREEPASAPPGSKFALTE